MPILKAGKDLDLVLASPLGEKPLKARVARRFSAGKSSFYGLAFEDLPVDEASELARDLYGSSCEFIAQGGLC